VTGDERIERSGAYWDAHNLAPAEDVRYWLAVPEIRWERRRRTPRGPPPLRPLPMVTRPRPPLRPSPAVVEQAADRVTSGVGRREEQKQEEERRGRSAQCVWG
jgi:hypothetical protein